MPTGKLTYNRYIASPVMLSVSKKSPPSRKKTEKTTYNNSNDISMSYSFVIFIYLFIYFQIAY